MDFIFFKKYGGVVTNIQLTNKKARNSLSFVENLMIYFILSEYNLHVYSIT